MRMISPLVMWRNRICIETYAGLKNEESLVEAFKGELDKAVKWVNVE